MICLLCKNKDADQTGSHIFTHSLVSKCTNEQGKKGRNKEMMFGFSQSGKKDLFVGNEVLPEKISEVRGRILTDDEVANNKNDIVVDNIYCLDCEKLFGKIESEFSRKILENIRSKKKYDFSNSDNLLIRSYFYIQIWRASSYKYNDWNLPLDTEEYLRNMIYEVCENYEHGLNSETKRKLLSFPLIINYLETPDDKSSSNWIFIPNETNPYLLFLCDFVIEFFNIQNNKPTLPDISNYHGLNDNLEENQINYNETTFKIRVIENSKREKIIYSFSKNEIAEGEIKRWQVRFFSEYLKAKRRFPSVDQMGEFMITLMNWEQMPSSAMEKLSDDRIDKIIQDIINTE